MRIFAIGDLHLEGGTGKTMDRFGEHWRHHDRKIFESWERLGADDDVLILAGDITWAIRLADAMPDLNRIANMKGTKVMLKGNHDYWWESLSKLTRTLPKSIKALNASSIVLGRVAIAATRGWLCPGDAFFEDRDQKIYDREVGRLRMALESLAGREREFDHLIVALHYPPTNEKHDASGFSELIDMSGAGACVYGHLHGEAIKTGLRGRRGNTVYYLVSADAVRFSPAEISLNVQGEQGESG